MGTALASLASPLVQGCLCGCLGSCRWPMAPVDVSGQLWATGTTLQYCGHTSLLTSQGLAHRLLTGLLERWKPCSSVTVVMAVRDSFWWKSPLFVFFFTDCSLLRCSCWTRIFMGALHSSCWTSPGTHVDCSCPVAANALPITKEFALYKLSAPVTRHGV
ncbi:hypothetical protein CRENBAI_021741 [Crenichthys baileyi]|uniref:Secreted protein n=1 Tax=Crenichthys baileyi TaxID=28760 RepID=A0AAV9QUC8_9TELE